MKEEEKEKGKRERRKMKRGKKDEMQSVSG